MATIIACLGLAIAVVTGTITQIVGGQATKLRSELMGLINDIARMMSKNNAAKEQLVNAWNDKNGRKLTSLMYGMGFGARIESLKREIEKDRKAMEAGVKTFNDSNIALEELTNKANAGVAAASGSSIGGIQDAQGAISEVKEGLESYKKQHDTADLNQNIQGGTVNEEVQKF